LSGDGLAGTAKGAGIDEQTALAVEPNGSAIVLGSGAAHQPLPRRAAGFIRSTTHIKMFQSRDGRNLVSWFFMSIFFT